jgi:hypothetical protein
MSISEEAKYESYDILQALLDRGRIDVSTKNPWKDRYSPSEFNEFLREFLNKYCDFVDYERIEHVRQHVDREFMLYSCEYAGSKFDVVVTRDWEYGQRRVVSRNGALTIEKEPRKVVKITVTKYKGRESEEEYYRGLLRDALSALAECNHELALAEYKLQHA